MRPNGAPVSASSKTGLRHIVAIALCVAGIALIALVVRSMLQRAPDAVDASQPGPSGATPGGASAPASSDSPSGVQETGMVSPEPAATPYVNKALTDAMALNKDVVGLITIPGTEISYPVVQAKDNTYYLTHNAAGKHAVAGAIFMDYRCDAQLLRHNIILYGHHMKNDTMFATLVNFKGASFFNTHKVIEYATPTGLTKWEVFSAYVTDTSFYYIQTDFASDGMYLDFIQKLQKKSLHKTDAVLTAEDDVLTLSTCTYEFENARFVVHARRVR
jgi:sortase B